MHTLYYCVEVCNTMELEGMHFRRSLFLLHAFESRYLAFYPSDPSVLPRSMNTLHMFSVVLSSLFEF